MCIALVHIWFFSLQCLYSFFLCFSILFEGIFKCNFSHLTSLSFFQTNQEQLITSVLPLIVRAYDDNDARIQEEVLRKSVSLAKQLDTQVRAPYLVSMISF